MLQEDMKTTEDMGEFTPKYHQDQLEKIGYGATPEWEKSFDEHFDTKHTQMHHIGKDTVRRSECEVCKRQKVTNPKGYYKTYLSEQKCYWNSEMYDDVKAFISQAILTARKETLENMIRYADDNIENHHFNRLWFKTHTQRYFLSEYGISLTEPGEELGK